MGLSGRGRNWGEERTHTHKHTHSWGRTLLSRFGSALHGNNDKKTTEAAGTECDCWGRTKLVLTKCYATCFLLLKTKEDAGISASQKTFIPVEVGSEFTWVVCPSLSVALRQASFDTHTLFFYFFFHIILSPSAKKLSWETAKVYKIIKSMERWPSQASIFGVKLEGFLWIQSSGNKK